MGLLNFRAVLYRSEQACNSVDSLFLTPVVIDSWQTSVCRQRSGKDFQNFETSRAWDKILRAIGIIEDETEAEVRTEAVSRWSLCSRTNANANTYGES